MLLWQGAIVFGVAFLVTYLMVPVSKWLSVKMGAIDYPGMRRVNETIVPRAGGIALYVGFLAGCAALAMGVKVFHWQPAQFFYLNDVNVGLLLFGITCMFLVGLVDDVSPLAPRSKLAGQFLAAALIYGAGVSIAEVRGIFTGDLLPLEWLDMPLTILYILIFVNVVNLIDGLDGLAAGLVAIMACSLMFLVIRRDNYVLALLCVAVVACCVAFLIFNFNPASIFMGDSGSHLLGTLLACVSIMGVVRTQSLAVSLVPLVIAGVPVMDTATAVIRRIREGKPIDEADKEHVHHRLLDAGFGQRRAVLTLYALSAVFAIVGYSMNVFSGPTRWALMIVFAFIIFVVVARLHLLDPVLLHHYRRQEKSEPRRRTTKKLY
ncbi:MAG: undecaprenyl/decaprenyl-phosphate alpha-N-acetylglucosaminyl 1-phosphate transferase [Eggerthellaceae bacterium]|nr:undecaprenyl/decaprenyl-phosphate alpha-N-acetylglucosaminyl 1-phosphate transferase [Eggerthellaceae bacterium]